MDIEALYAASLEDIPERVEVTGMLDPYGRKRISALFCILEEVPDDWAYQGGGSISVSDAYSRAGVRSIRWDWQAGDVIRIPDLGVLSDLDIFDNYHEPEGVVPFEMHIFQEAALPRNTRFSVYLKRVDKDRSGAVEGYRIVRLDYYMNFEGTWYKIGGSQADSSVFRRRVGPVVNNLTILDAMPDSVPEPGLNEIVLHAPTDVASGTFYLDRLIAPASVPYDSFLETESHTYLRYGHNATRDSWERRVCPIPISQQPSSVTAGIPDEPIDPTLFDPTRPNYYGYYAERPPLPEALTAEQQAYIDGLRERFFQTPDPLAPGSPRYTAIEDQARAVLARDCVRTEDGRYRFRESINFGGQLPWLAEETFAYRKHIQHLPPQLVSDGGLRASSHVRVLFGRYADWYAACPDSEPVRALLLAYLDWFRYQVYNPPMSAEGFDSFKYNGAYIIDGARKIIATMRGQGREEDRPYMDYVGDLALWCGFAHTSAFSQFGEGLRGEFVADNYFHSVLFETDDRELFRMLAALRGLFTRTFTISQTHNLGMIKPDYTFYHHAHQSYWHGNYFEQVKAVEHFAGTPLDYDPEILRTFAWYSTRYTFGVLACPENINGGQGSDFNFFRLEAAYGRDPEAFEPTPAFSVDAWPRRDVFELFYHMDWEAVPAATKYLAGVVGITEQHPPQVRDALLAEYPRLAEVVSQPDIHLSANWTGASTYCRGMARVHIGGYNDKDATPSRPQDRWSWNRGFGSLYISENDRVYGRPPLGASHEGYSWSKAPGITMPAITEEDYIEHQDVGLNARGGAGNGSLTFNETEERFGTSGNYAFQTLPHENQNIWRLFGIDGVEGRKSYHVYRDLIVCLGSDYHADTDRHMETVLFQEGIDDGPIWHNRNPRRWDPERPTLVLNGEVYTDDVTRTVPLDEPNYLVSPFGHAWLIPGGQAGQLTIDWRERETLYQYRWGSDADGNNDADGQRMTTGTNVIAALDHGDARTPSAHHYCVLLNSDGKSPADFAAYAGQTLHNPRYEVLRHDRHAHAVAFQPDDAPGDLYSYIIYSPDVSLGLPYIASANTRLNLMMLQNDDDHLVLSICDPHINIVREAGAAHGYSQEREVRVTFSANLNIELLDSTSGLPEANPLLDARVEGNTLVFTTKNGVTDTFRLAVD